MAKKSAKKPPGKGPAPRKPAPVQTGPSNRALRMTFSYEGDRISLVSQQRVDMILPPSHPVDAPRGQAGFWFAVHDAKDRPVYRRVIQNPMRHDVEVFSPEGEASIHRRPVEKPRGAFTILVPEIEGAQSVAIFSHPLKPGAMALRAAEVARFKVVKEK